MSDDYKRVEKKEEPGKVGATFIKYAFITIITIIILFFIVNYLLPMLPGGDDGAGGGNGNGDNGEDSINIEINEDFVDELDGDGDDG
ncbi:hypothetical protein [Salipaludibacillus aurantiacus]|uniref:Uncharacterized protein n=1 Tax=Salipaludibacillus aurantiacus TaxID=1601833 RepID=A0A1H9X416_9BACI|nr:hypothetical protein [Salipaludibacillus aurantiacus]SES40353.1 hypothetical protein SAMN05518684_12348 [Salipaludibacillus aurantiacus]